MGKNKSPLPINPSTPARSVKTGYKLPFLTIYTKRYSRSTFRTPGQILKYLNIVNTSMFSSYHQHWRWSDYSALNGTDVARTLFILNIFNPLGTDVATLFILNIFNPLGTDVASTLFILPLPSHLFPGIAVTQVLTH